MVVRQPVPNTRRYTSVRQQIPYTRQLPLEIVDTRIWGAPLWRILHTLSLLATTDAARNAWIRLVVDLDGALPCPECAQHYHDWIRAHPLTATDGDAVRDWVLALHNQVNERKQIAPWTAEQIVATYGSVTVADVVTALTPLRERLGSRGLQAIDALISVCKPAE